MITIIILLIFFGSLSCYLLYWTTRNAVEIGKVLGIIVKNQQHIYDAITGKAKK